MSRLNPTASLTTIRPQEMRAEFLPRVRPNAAARLDAPGSHARLTPRKHLIYGLD
jgi:hypothetical protein